MTVAMTAVLGLLMTGCGGPSSSANIRGAVKGKVTLDGEPVPQGSILFLPQEGTKGPAGGGTIKDGVYDLKVEQGAAIGKNRVEINAPRKTGKQISSQDGQKQIDEVEESIPAKYNKKSILEEDVQKGTNEFNFDLESK